MPMRKWKYHDSWYFHLRSLTRAATAFKASKRPFTSGIQDINVKERQARLLHPYALCSPALSALLLLCMHSHFLVTQLSDKIFSQVLPSFKSHHKLRHTSDLDLKSSSTSVFKPSRAAHGSRLLFSQGNTRCSWPRCYLWITLFFQAPPVHISSAHYGPPSTIQMNNSLCKPDLSNSCRRPTTPRLDFCRHPMAHISHAPRLLPVCALSCPGGQLPQSDRVRAAG
ncbi:hypothetical protein B0H11DRAFT_2002244 [Mycena galericulata]|nr:hypothetical protein B0H11DRAFT_2002244 [Mycena galericulata]